MTIFIEICLTIILGSLGIAANAGILIFSRILGTGPKRKKLSFGGYSTDETNSDQRSNRTNSDVHRLSEGHIYKRSTVLTPNADISLLRLSSMLSINRLEHEIIIPKDRFQKHPKFSSQLQSRRHRIYIQGLLILSCSNLFTACLLLINSFGVYWHRNKEEIFSNVNSTFNTHAYTTSISACFDLLQAAEISAILWIAVNRAHAIHRTSQHSYRRSSEPISKYIQGSAVRISSTRESNVCCSFCLWSYSRREEQSGENTALEFGSLPTERVFVLRLMKCSRYFVCVLPLLVVLIVVSGSAFTWVMEPVIEESSEMLDDSSYYTTSMRIGILLGIFLMPSSFLLSTNCMIYRKVAKRHKRFLSRQSSKNSKDTITNDEETVTSLKSDYYTRLPRFSDCTPGSLPIPTFTITESSTHNLTDINENPRWNVDHDVETCRKYGTAQNPVKTYLNFLSVRGLHQASSTGDVEGLTSVSSTHLATSKSFNDVLQESSVVQGSHVDLTFIKLLQRQHRRTVVVLLSILVVFLVCHGPRALCLFMEWNWLLGTGAKRLLRYTTLWSHLCILIDPVLYGFWGNRAYRNCLRNISSHLTPWR